MRVRVTGVVIEDGHILLLNQDTDTDRSWSLSGGKVEARPWPGVSDPTPFLSTRPVGFRTI